MGAPKRHGNCNPGVGGGAAVRRRALLQLPLFLPPAQCWRPASRASLLVLLYLLNAFSPFILLLPVLFVLTFLPLISVVSGALPWKLIPTALTS